MSPNLGRLEVRAEAVEHSEAVRSRRPPPPVAPPVEPPGSPPRGAVRRLLLLVRPGCLSLCRR